MIVACDHPARGALGASGNPTAMADRTELLERLVTALSRPGVDGLLATADIAEDLLLLGALEGKLVFSSINRGGLQGSAFELDDRATGYDVRGTIESRFDGAKMLTRIDLADPATVATLEMCARAVTDLNRAGRIAMVEPFMSSRVGNAVVNDLSADAVIKSIAIASGSGRLQRVHLDEAPGRARDGAGDGRDHDADPVARRRSGQRSGRDVRGLAGGPGPAVGARPGGRAHHALPGRRRRGQGGRHRRLPGALRSLSMSELYLPAGAAAAGPYDLEITPTSAGWGYSSLRVITLDAGAEHGFSCAGEEIIVVPLSGGASVVTGRETFTLVGRTDVFAGPTDIVYLPAGSTATLTSTDGGRYALCGAVSDADAAGALRSRRRGTGRAARGGPVQPPGPQLRHAAGAGRRARSSPAR